MNRLFVIALVALFAAVAHPAAQQHNAALDKLFASAQHKATVEGDLRGAIDAYRRIVAAAGENRAAAAQALLRMAETFELLGDQEAQKIYRRLVSDYSERGEAAVARAHLSPAGAGKTTTLRIERVLQAGRPHYRISPDARYIARPAESGNLELLDLRTGTATSLTSDGTSTDPGHQFPLASTFSRDGKQVAYQWFIEDENRSVLRAVSTVAGSRLRVLYGNPDLNFAPTDWSPDGKWIAGVAQRKDRTAQIALVGSDGSYRALKTVEWSRVGGVRFSPDSSRLAFHLPSVDGGFTRDVYVMTLVGAAKETVVASSTGDDTLLEWATDGRSLLVASDRGGTTSLWRVPADGRNGGSQFELVKSDTGVMSSLGPTVDGTLYYNHQPGRSGVFVAQYDRVRGQLSSTPITPFKQFKGVTGGAQWSRDGRFLVYESWRDIPDPINVTRPVVTFVSAETGEFIRELLPALAYGGMGSLSADNAYFIVRGSDLKGRGSFVRVDAATGAATSIVENDTCSGVGTRAPDSESFFCYDFEKKVILQVDVKGQVLRRYASAGQALSLSPDGHNVACAGQGLPILSLETGTIRELIPPITSETLQFRAWSPDGRAVLAYGPLKGEQGLWLIPVDGSTPHKIDVEAPAGITSWSFNPKTDQVLFTTGGGRWQLEVWKLEIPESTSAQLAVK